MSLGQISIVGKMPFVKIQPSEEIRHLVADQDLTREVLVPIGAFVGARHDHRAFEVCFYVRIYSDRDVKTGFQGTTTTLINGIGHEFSVESLKPNKYIIKYVESDKAGDEKMITLQLNFKIIEEMFHFTIEQTD